MMWWEGVYVVVVYFLILVELRVLFVDMRVEVGRIVMEGDVKVFEEFVVVG